MANNHGIHRTNSILDSQTITPTSDLINSKFFVKNRKLSKNDNLDCLVEDKPFQNENNSSMNLFSSNQKNSLNLRFNRVSYASNLDQYDNAINNENRFADYNCQSVSNLKFPNENEASLVDSSCIINNECLLEKPLTTRKSKLSKSTVSLSELDNIKKQTINNLKSYNSKFQTINPKFKFTSDLMKKFNVFHSKEPFLERLVRKNGEANLDRINIERRHRKYISDFFNTIVDMKWHFIIFIFISSFIFSWMVFAVFWHLMNNYYDQECISNVHPNSSFFEFLLFSIETQQTIGYGYRYITHECRLILIILMMQSSFSVFLESFMGGVVFAKLSRPKKRTETLIFSRQAVISPRDGVLCLMCRVGDLRKSHIIQAYVKMFLIMTRYTQEGEIIPCNAQELIVNNLNSTDRLLFMPSIIEHQIDHKSPLNKIIKKNEPKFINENFEIIVILEGF